MKRPFALIIGILALVVIFQLMFIRVQSAHIKLLLEEVHLLSKEVSYKKLQKIVLKENQKILLLSWVAEKAGDQVSAADIENIVDHVLETEYPFMILSLVQRESSFNRKAVSKTGALGLGQVFWSHHKEQLKTIGLRSSNDLFEIGMNVQAIEAIFKTYLHKAKGDWTLALRFYRGENDHKYLLDIFKNYAEINLLVKRA